MAQLYTQCSMKEYYHCVSSLAIIIIIHFMVINENNFVIILLQSDSLWVSNLLSVPPTNSVRQVQILSPLLQIRKPEWKLVGDRVTFACKVDYSGWGREEAVRPVRRQPYNPVLMVRCGGDDFFEDAQQFLHGRMTCKLSHEWFLLMFTHKKVSSLLFFLG